MLSELHQCPSLVSRAALFWEFGSYYLFSTLAKKAVNSHFLYCIVFGALVTWGASVSPSERLLCVCVCGCGQQGFKTMKISSTHPTWGYFEINVAISLCDIVKKNLVSLQSSPRRQSRPAEVFLLFSGGGGTSGWGSGQVASSDNQPGLRRQNIQVVRLLQ